MASPEANGRVTTDVDAEETRDWLESLESVRRLRRPCDPVGRLQSRTDPEVAWIGLTETEAKAQGTPYEKETFPWADAEDLGLTRNLKEDQAWRVPPPPQAGCSTSRASTTAWRW